MTKLPILSLVAVLLATPLSAQTAAPAPEPLVIKHNATIVAADGRKVGRVDRLRGDQAIVLTQGRLVAIPVASLIADGARFKTSLTTADIARR